MADHRLSDFPRAPAVYRATLRSMAGLVLVALFSAGLLLYLACAPSTPALVALGVAPLLLLAAARARLRVVIGPDELIYQGLFATTAVRLAAIDWGGWVAEQGYLRSRLHGPFVYELRAGESAIRINLKLFPRECTDHLVGLVQFHSLKHERSHRSGDGHGLDQT